MIIRSNLSNEFSNNISFENIYRNNNEVLIHLIYSLRSAHISGYYLIRINYQGLSRFNDVGNTDSRIEVIISIDTDDYRKLKITGVDEV